ncbi:MULTISPECIES: DUF3857 domain-containing protein [Rhodopirellula]|uniref:DUF3857 domain-containing protein n=1 Tax=Rhodopirellula TaxID=265488 RepID=UPI00257CFC99|nr:DUF3857 domain-containing protein [Rhodopirellula sp. UBA1907]
MRSRTCFLSLAWSLSFALAVFTTGTANAAEVGVDLPWEGDLFEAEADAVLDAVAKIPHPEADESEYLVWDERIQISADHRVTNTERHVYRILSRDDIETRGSLAAAWTPWLEERPLMRARVITRDGHVHELDPATITESSGSNVQNQVYTDTRILTAPLPAIAIGSIIETEVITTEHTAFCPAGIVGNVIWERFSKCHHLYAEVRADASIDLSLHCVGKTVPLEIQRDGDEQVWSLKQNQPDPLEVLWDYAPSDHTPMSFVTYCTGTSWAEIAQYYDEMVNRQIADSELGNLPDQVKQAWRADHDEDDRRTLVTTAWEQIMNSIRYTGIEFGVSAIQPARPIDTLRRRYGDCKDQACLMVAMLRQLDIEAYVALQSTQSFVDAAADAPALNAFDHAIVYVPRQDNLKETWIDMTASYTSFGELPISDQDRLTLVAAPTTKKLRRTRASRSSDNMRRYKTVYQLKANGPSTARVTSSSTGIFASYMRAAYASQTRPQIETSLKDQFKEIYGDAELSELDYDDPNQPTSPEFTVKYNLDSTGICTNDAGRLVIELDPGAAFNYLPYEFIGPECDQLPEDPDAIERTIPYEISRFIYRTEMELHPPSGFEVVSLPKRQTIQVGKFQVAMSCESNPDGTVHFQIQLNTGDGKLSPEQLPEFRDEFLALSNNAAPSEWFVPIEFAYQPTLKFENGEEAGALHQMLQIAEESPDDLFNRSELSSALLKVGLVRESQEVADQLVADAPESELAHWASAWASMHDQRGHNMYPGIDREKVVSSLRRMVELNPSSVDGRYNLAMVLEHDSELTRYSDRELMLEAAKIYRSLLDEQAYELVVVNYGLLLAHLEDTQALRRLVRSYPTLGEPWIFLAVAEINQNGVAAGNRLIDKAPNTLDSNFIQINVAARLRTFRQYELLQEFLETRSDLQGVSSTLRYLQRYEDVKLEPSDPASVVQSFLARCLRFGPDLEKLRDLYTSSDNDEFIVADIERLPPALHQLYEVVRTTFGQPALSEDMVSLYEFEVEGDDVGGYTVTASIIDDVDIPNSSITRQVVRDGDSFRILHPGRFLHNYGIKALELIDNGHVEEAKAWINPLYQVERNRVGMFNQFAASPFAQSWFASSESDVQALRLAALILASRNRADQSIADELVKVRDQYPALLQLQIDRCRLTYLAGQQRFEELLELSTQMLENYPLNPELLNARLKAELGLGEYEQAESTMKLLEGQESASGINSHLAYLTKTDGHDRALEYARQLHEKKPEITSLLSTIGWRSLFVGKSAECIEEALAARNKSITVRELSANLHTLACVYADDGQLTKAFSTLTEAINARNGLDESFDQLVRGRIAQRCGLPEAAERYYREVQPAMFDEPTGASCVELANRWIESLETTEE